jgi:hypothetical protein
MFVPVCVLFVSLCWTNPGFRLSSLETKSHPDGLYSQLFLPFFEKSARESIDVCPLIRKKVVTASQTRKKTSGTVPECWRLCIFHRFFSTISSGSGSTVSLSRADHTICGVKPPFISLLLNWETLFLKNLFFYFYVFVDSFVKMFKEIKKDCGVEVKET